MDLREIGIDGANWIWVAQDRVQWQVCVNTVMNLQVPLKKKKKTGYFDKPSDNQLFK
jgi:hypothetical protein